MEKKIIKSINKEGVSSMQTLTHYICEYIPTIKGTKSLKERSNTINKLKREYPKARIYYDNGFVMCEYKETKGS